MAVSCALKTLTLVCAFVSISSLRWHSVRDYYQSKLEDTGYDYFSSKEIPISMSNRSVITEKWFTYIIELASRFDKVKSISEVFLHLHENTQRAFNWCRPNETPNYIINFTKDSELKELDIYNHIPCGKVVFSKLSTQENRKYAHFINLGPRRQTTTNKGTHATFGINLTIQSFTSSEYKQYLTGNLKETMCQYVVLSIIYEFLTPENEKTYTDYWCGEILGKDMIFQQGQVGIFTGSKNPLDAFQLVMHYQALNFASDIYADRPIDIYSYNSSSTFYPRLWYSDRSNIEDVFVSLLRWHIKAIIGQNINLVVYKTSKCKDELEAVSIYDGPLKIYDQLVCVVTKEPSEPSAEKGQTGPSVETEPTGPSVERGPSERSTQKEQAELIMPLVSYTSTFKSQIHYCFDVKQHSNIFFTFEVQAMASTRIHVEHDQKYQLQVSSGTNTIYYRSWQFTSDSFIRLELAALRLFRGRTYQCLYGGMVLSDIGNPLELQYGSICTTCQGYEPLFSTSYWYFNKHGGVLTVYAFYNYFTIDMDLILTSQHCEGITNICSTHCM